MSNAEPRITDRLRFALTRLQPSDWERFERLASAFVGSELENLRTTASPSGDLGRDSELFCPAAEPRVLLQYSVSADWQAKIGRTVRRIQETFPEANVLVYVTSQVIGAAADALKRRLRTDHGLTLDTRDQNWFVERVYSSRTREKAAEELAEAIVDPLLRSSGVAPTYAPSDLSSSEAIAALTFLGLQWRDDVREKGLTKLAFQALVRAVLADTDNEHRLSRALVHERVNRLLPGHAASDVRQRVDSALERLTKRAIRHWQKEDEFCLSHEEKERAAEFRAGAALAELKVMDWIRERCQPILSAQKIPMHIQASFPTLVRSASEAVLFERSQAFAMAVQTGRLGTFADADSTDVLLMQISQATLPKIKGLDWLQTLATCARELLSTEDLAVQSHLRSLADAYTLLAFLRQTPDVQGAVEKMFSHGQVWLDTCVVLPLLVEPLFDGPPGRFTRMIQAAQEAGLQLFVTAGVVEEIERHMNRALTCLRMERGQWIGAVPYLLERFLASGRSQAGFANWLETFRGDTRPREDIAIYLLEELGIATQSLEAERDASNPELRHALQILWYHAHRMRRERQGAPISEMTITRLVEHDLECYCGITQIRRSERASPFGYSAWWLTVDRQAFDLKDKLREAMTGDPPDSPVLSADFMVNYRDCSKDMGYLLSVTGVVE